MKYEEELALERQAWEEKCPSMPFSEHQLMEAERLIGLFITDITEVSEDYEPGTVTYVHSKADRPHLIRLLERLKEEVFNQ